jgi:hypothetical protein
VKDVVLDRVWSMGIPDRIMAEHSGWEPRVERVRPHSPPEPPSPPVDGESALQVSAKEEHRGGMAPVEGFCREGWEGSGSHWPPAWQRWRNTGAKFCPVL